MLGIQSIYGLSPGQKHAEIQDGTDGKPVNSIMIIKVFSIVSKLSRQISLQIQKINVNNYFVFRLCLNLVDPPGPRVEIEKNQNMTYCSVYYSALKSDLNIYCINITPEEFVNRSPVYGPGQESTRLSNGSWTFFR